MSTFENTNHYDFHGLGVQVSSDDGALLAALHARLRRFAVGGGGASDLSFEFHRDSETGQRQAARPQDGLRSVYEPHVGEVVYSDLSDRLYINYGARAHVLCEPEAGRVRASIFPAEGETAWLASRPLFTLPLIELLKRRGLFSLHAAGLSLNGKGLLLPGTSGAGKSTLAVALLRAGLSFLADDLLFLERRPAGLRVLAFPDEIDLTDQTAGLFPELHRCWNRPKPPGWAKRPVPPEEVCRVEYAWECRAAAIVFPRVAHAEKSVLTPIGPDEAFLELVPNVLLTEPRSSQAHLGTLAELVHEAPAFRLETGRDLEALARLLRDLIV